MSEGKPGHSVSIGERTLRISDHALDRLRLRGISTEVMAETILKGEHFQYFHDGIWKDGYYDKRSALFVGVVDEIITTAIKGVSDSYIANLKAGAP